MPNLFFTIVVVLFNPLKVRLQFELTYYDSVVQRFNHYTTETSREYSEKRSTALKQVKYS